jgi:hypothetical protein
MRKFVAIGAVLACTLSTTREASAQSRTEQALDLLRQTLMCPLPPKVSDSGGDLTDRTLSSLHFTGDARRLSGYQTTTTRTHNTFTNTVNVTEGRIEVSANFADIDRVQVKQGYMTLACAGDHGCFHVISPLGITDSNDISQNFCDSATADNAKAAIEELIRINGGHVSTR